MSEEMKKEINEEEMGDVNGGSVADILKKLAELGDDKERVSCPICRTFHIRGQKCPKKELVELV